MATITEIVQTWAEAQWDEPDFSMSDDGSKATLKFITSGSSDVNYNAFCEARESIDVVELFLYAPMTIPADQRSAVADALARINFQNSIGQLELDMDDGVLRFRAGIDVEGGQLSGQMLDNLRGRGNQILDRYLPAITAVVYAGVTPSHAVAEADGNGPAHQDFAETEPAQDAAPWQSIPGADLLRAWAEDLRSACALKDEDEWRDVGRAVVLITEESQRCPSALRRVAQDAGMRYLHINAKDVMQLPPHAAFAKLAPALIFLEPGGWSLDRQENDSDEDAAGVTRFQQRLLQWMGDFDVSRPIVLCTSIEKLGEMADCIDGPNRFDRYFALPPIAMAARGEEFIEKLGRDRCGKSLTSSPAKLGKLLDNKFAKVTRHDLAILYLRRLCKKARRPVEFLDMMHLSTHGFSEAGTVEAASDDVRRQTAAHEAGHAAIAVIDSAGRNVPDYCSIVPGVGFNGVVAESISYHQSLGDRITYADFRHEIRIGLAGRAAEELVFGAERVSNGASGDLENVWQRSCRAFARWGFAPQMETGNASSTNLAVIVGDPTPSEQAFVEANIRRFVAHEYEVVLQCLADNRDLLNAISDRLLWDPIVDQSELADICRTHLLLGNWPSLNASTPATLELLNKPVTLRSQLAGK